MKIIILFFTYLFLSTNAHAVIELSSEESKKYNHIKKLPIAFANWGDDAVDYLTLNARLLCKPGAGFEIKSEAKQLKITKNNQQINMAVKCVVLETGYTKFLRNMKTDEMADRHCRKYDKKAYYRGPAEISKAPAARLGQLAGFVGTIGLASNKVHVSASYVCGLEKDPGIVYEKEYAKYENNFRNKSDLQKCELITDPVSGMMLSFEEPQALVHQKYFSLSEAECKKITGRYTTTELNKIALQKENEKKARELEIAKLEAEEKEKKRLAILERKRLDKIEIDRISELGNKELCEESLSDNGDFKSLDGVNKFQIEEVNKRKISQNECRQITGIYPEEILARMQKKEECEEIGFKDSEKIADCILRLIEAESLIKSKEIEAVENNKLLAEQTKLDKALEDQMARFEIEQKKLDILLKQLEQAESQTAAAQEQAAAARAQAAAAALAASEAKKANRREGLKEAERQMKKGACMANNYDFWNC